MISVKFNKTVADLDFIFDVPVPSSAQSHLEFKSFRGKLFKKGIKLHHDDKNEIVKISCGLKNWIEFAESVLNHYEIVFQRAVLDGLEDLDSPELGDELDVNFHQKTFDSSDRYWAFILNQGNFISYFFNRINWYFAPKNSIVTPFPLHVDVESANTCNMACPMCYNSEITDLGQIKLPLFKKVVDECAAHSVYSMRLSWRGETLSHPKIKEMIAYATKKIKNVSFLTNAFYLKDDMVDCFIDNGVSYIAVSFDGIDGIYEAIRSPAIFKESYERLVNLRDKKLKANSKLPQVRVCTIWPAVSQDPDAYCDKMREVSDYMVCNPYINFKMPMAIKDDFVCQYPWERIVVGHNGKTQCCTGWEATDIILGNAEEQSIQEMWHSDLMNNIRDRHRNGKRMELSSCSNCRHGQKGDPNISIEEILERQY